MVHAAGGDIQVESIAGKGSTFRIVLPRVAPREEAAAESTAQRSSARRGRILVVDDDKVVLRLVQRILSVHELVCVSSVREALETIRRDAFDLVLSDVMMPDATGIDLYESLLASAPDAAARVIFMTGGTINDTLDAFLSSIPNTCLRKPFQIDHLRSEVQRHLDIH